MRLILPPLPSPDALIEAFDHSLRVSFLRPEAKRPCPAENLGPIELSQSERRHSAGLMRVNHTGEVCAQALYRGQALVSRDPETRAALEKAANEEMDHLGWCRARLDELDERPSQLDLLWYVTSFGLGVVASLAGDRWNMAFLVETEQQVEQHLAQHLESLPARDLRSRAIVDVMRAEEIEHAHMAKGRGAAPMPQLIKSAMRLTAKVMTTLAYRI